LSPSHSATGRRAGSLGLLALLAMASACTSPQRFARESDEIVEDVLGGSSERLNAERRATVERPKDKASETAPAPAAATVESRVLTLREALEIGVKSNRGYIGELESLYRQALGLYSTRHNFGPLLSSTLNYVFSGGGGAETGSTSLGLGVSQKLPWGGNISASADSSYAADYGGSPATSSVGASISLTQPLLRGRGVEIGMEGLVQAERGMMYAIREFELFRENFTIDVARQFYGLVQQKQGLENQRRNLEDVIFGRRQAEAMFALGDVSELEVLRSRRSELTSRNELISAEEDLRRALDSFRIFLGLPENVTIDVRDEPPTFVAVAYDVESAIAVAFENRLDVLTRQQRLEDSERGLRIAENSSLPDVGLSLSYGLGAQGDSGFQLHSFDDPSYSASVSVGLPIDRTSDRESLRNAQIGHRQALRAYEEFRQTLEINLRSTFRELDRRVQSLDIQRQLIADQERNAKIAQLRFEQGDFSNRDVVEAQRALLDARNALIREQVDYEIARLGLIRDLGLLFIDEHGMWTE